MDTQICSLEIESCQYPRSGGGFAYNDLFPAIVDGYSVKDIIYRWFEGPKDSVGIDEEVQLPQFNVRGHKAKERIQKLSTGTQSSTQSNQMIAK